MHCNSMYVCVVATIIAYRLADTFTLCTLHSCIHIGGGHVAVVGV